MSVCLSREQPADFHEIWFGLFTKICRHIQMLVKIGEQSPVRHDMKERNVVRFEQKL
jgi:hypothetical protein